ncbi:MAG: ORF6N domain-containing protein, partial [Deltaproteobacteria bacterium]
MAKAGVLIPAERIERAVLLIRGHKVLLDSDLRCQIGISSSWGGRRTPPYAFTEQGVAMLSS